MKQRAITAIFIVLTYALFILLSIYLPQEYGKYFYDILIVAMMVIAGIEMSKALDKKFGKPIWQLVVINILLGYGVFIAVQNIEFFRGKNNGGITAFFGQTFLMFLICIIVNMVRQKQAQKNTEELTVYQENAESKKTDKVDIRNILTTMFVMVYPVSLMVYMLAINYLPVAQNDLRVMAIMLTFLISSLTDTFAYLVGRQIGGAKLAPIISPKKTISGAVGGIFGGIVAAFLVLLMGRFGVLNIVLFGGSNASLTTQTVHLLIIGIVASVLNQFGDIVASYVKRACGAKDFGSIMPGHGGVLDRVDGMMLVAIFVYTYIMIYGIFVIPA